MIPKLTPELIEALQNGDQPVAVKNPDAHQVAYLISDDLYQRLRPLLETEGEFDPTEFLPHAHEAFAEDWDAPGIEEDDGDNTTDVPPGCLPTP